MIATKNRYLECLNYVYEKGCPVNYRTLECEILNGQTECAEYIMHVLDKSNLY